MVYNIMDRIYKYNSDASYKPNGGTYLQLITAKDLYIQNVTVAEHDGGHSDSFQVKFPNIFTNYLLGEVRLEDQKFKDWDHYKFTIWQSQLNFAIFCASSACGVSVEHLNAKQPMIRSIYRFHVYYHIRRILKILEIPLPYENSFNQYNNSYNHEKFIGICSEYGVSNNLTKWRNQKYFSTWQSRAWETGKPGMSYINENSFSRWIIEKSDGLTTLGLQKISESVRDYAYLILTSQTSTRGPNLDAQHTFLNTFENIVNRRVNIPEDIQRFQKTLQYARSKVDYAIGEFIYMLPSDMNLRIGNVRNYNNKILISSPSFKIGTNVKVNIDVKSKEVDNQRLMVKTEPDVKPKVITKPKIKPNKEHKQDVKPNIKFDRESNQNVKKPDTNEITYEEEKVALVLGTTAVFTVWWMFK